MENKEIIEQRKLIPVVAMVSAGKSKLLNVLYNINFLECKPGISTKFVNILRYNPNIKQPCFYHLKVEKKDDNYIFYKDFKVAEGTKNIIEANKNINETFRAEIKTNYEDIFYMTEINEAPFFKDKDFLLSHDLCDIPGLSESPNNIDNEIKEKPNNNNNNVKDENFKKQAKELGLIVKEEKNSIHEEKKENNFEDDIYSKIDVENEHTYLTEIFKIIKKYIDGAIIILSIQNYYKLENFVIIAKLYKVIQKEISNFLIILNKMDLSLNPQNDIQKCKGLLIQHFQNFKIFNINLNTFIPLSVDKLQNELLMDKNFNNLINYHFYNYMSKIIQERNNKQTLAGNTFIGHLIDIIKTVGAIKKKEIESEVEKLNERDNIDKINKEIIEIINNIKENFTASGINLGISEQDFINENEETLPEPDELDEANNGEDINNINPTYIIKYFYICHENKKNLPIPLLSQETFNLFEYFSNKRIILKIENKQTKEDGIVEKTKKNREIIRHLDDISNKFEKSKFHIKEIENIINEIKKVIEYLKIYDFILIPFMGSSNAGKTTIINGIIGKEILPTDLNECTKRGIIIRYSDDNENDISIGKAGFKEKKFLDSTSYYFEDEHIIGVGLKQVRETLQGLNYDFNKSEKDSFYFIKTKIKLFDDLGLSSEDKKMIYLIDFPGYGTGNIFETEIYKKVMSICNAFIFVIKNSVINENDTKEILDLMFTQAKQQKNKLSNRFIKSCLFVLNNINQQSTGDKDIEIAKNDIKNIIKGVEKENINITFFNAKFYSNYCANLNYFFNLENLFKMEHNEYIVYQGNINKYPENYTSKTYKTFGGFIYTKLLDKIKTEEIGSGAIKKNQKVNENVEEEIKMINKKNNFINQKDYKKYGKFIEKAISYGQENINKLKTLKESNIEKMKDKFSKQINIINEEMQIDIKEKIKEVISILDLLFSDIKEIDSNQKKEIRRIVRENCEKLELLKQASNGYIESISNKLKEKMKISLEKKKNNIHELFQSKNYKEILKEINEDIFNNLKELNEIIKFYLNTFNLKSKILIDEINQKFKIYSKLLMKNNEKDIDFKTYFSIKSGEKNKDLTKEIYEEIINSAKSLKNIFNNKGFLNWFKSLFFKDDYFSNIIDILIDTYLIRVNNTFFLLEKYFKLYVNRNIYLADINSSFILGKFNKEQDNIWKELKNYYEKKKIEINKIKFD